MTVTLTLVIAKKYQIRAEHHYAGVRNFYCYAECCYADGVMLRVAMLGVIMLSDLVPCQ